MDIMTGILINLFDGYLFTLIAAKFCNMRRDSLKTKLSFIVLFTFVTTILNVLIQYKPAAILTCLSIYWVILLIFYKQKIGILLSLIIWTLAMIVFELAAAVGLSIITRISISNIVLDDNLYSIILSFLSRTLEYIFVFFVFNDMDGSTITRTYNRYQFVFFILSSIMIINSFILYGFILNNVRVSYGFINYFALCTAAFLFSILYLFFRLINLTREKEELLLFKQQSQAQERFAQEISVIIEYFHELKHDYRHHLQILQNLISEAKLEKANEYFDELLTDYSDFSKGWGFIENQMIISLLLMEKDKFARENDIVFKCLVPKNINTNIKESDLNIILSNLLENAFEAIQRIELDKWVYISIQHIRDRLFIEIENPIKEAVKKEKSFFKTYKQNLNEHGYGLKSVHRIVNEYKGSLEIHTDNGIFRVEIAIPVC